jgi:hypothetical protein
MNELPALMRGERRNVVDTDEQKERRNGGSAVVLYDPWKNK